MLKPMKDKQQQPVYWHCDCGKTKLYGPQKIKVIAMRHGESQHNVLGVVNGNPKKIFHLTAKGKQQAKALALKLKNKEIAAIIASQMKRTQETAAPLAKLKKIKVQVDKRINDINAGRLEGISILEFRKLTGEIHRSVKGSETSKHVAIRIKSFLEDLVNYYSGQTVAVVTSEIILHALRQISKGKIYDEAKGHHVQNGVAYEFTINSTVCCKHCGGKSRV
jgi:broad specificity phosphatase PhoE